MKVILLEELKGRGGEGDVIDVANGFANNYLYPKKIAIPATKGNLKQLELRKHNIEKREETRINAATGTKESLEGIVVKIEAQVGEEGQLFGSVTSQMIAEALREATGIDVDKKRVDLKASIKTAGEHEVVVSLYRDIKTTVRILVGSAEDSAAEEQPVAEAEEAVEVEEVVTEAVEEAEAGNEASESFEAPEAESAAAAAAE